MGGGSPNSSYIFYCFSRVTARQRRNPTQEKLCRKRNLEANQPHPRTPQPPNLMFYLRKTSVFERRPFWFLCVPGVTFGPFWESSGGFLRLPGCLEAPLGAPRGHPSWLQMLPRPSGSAQGPKGTPEGDPNRSESLPKRSTNVSSHVFLYCLVECCLVIWLFCLLLSCSSLVLSCLVLSCLLLLLLSCLVLSCLVLSCLVFSCLVWSCLVLSPLVLSCLVLSCLVLSCLVIGLSCPVLSFPVLSCIFVS